MSITAERKQELITEFATKEGDTGSPEVQVAILTERNHQPDRTLQVPRQGQPLPPRPSERWSASVAACLTMSRSAMLSVTRPLIKRLGIRR